MASEHGSLVQFAKEKGLSISNLKKHAADEGWIAARAELEPAAMARAREKIIAEVADDAVERMRNWLTVADQLTANALQALMNKGKDMDLTEAIKAIKLAADLEARVFGIETNQGGKGSNGDGPGIEFNQVNIGKIENNQVAVTQIRSEIQGKLDRIAAKSATGKVSPEPDA